MIGNELHTRVWLYLKLKSYPGPMKQIGYGILSHSLLWLVTEWWALMMRMSHDDGVFSLLADLEIFLNWKRKETGSGERKAFRSRRYILKSVQLQVVLFQPTITCHASWRLSASISASVVRLSSQPVTSDRTARSFSRETDNLARGRDASVETVRMPGEAFFVCFIA